VQELVEQVDVIRTKKLFDGFLK